MRALRIVAVIVGATLYQGLRVIVAALRGVPQRPGGIYDRVPREWAATLLRASGITYQVEGAERLAAARLVREGRSVIVFVEGTRSRDGRIQEFKKGAFVLAIEARVPVVPVYVAGSFALMPRGRMIPRPGHVTLRIAAPIPTAGLAYDDRQALLDRARESLHALAAIDVVGVAG